MKRLLYRLLLWSHPRRFREQFGDEMLSIFEDAGRESGTALLADGVISLLRQRIVRSNLWKLACGAAISACVICLWASAIHYAMGPSLVLIMQRSMKLQWEPPSADSRLDKEEFQREAAAAVAILAENRKKEERQRRAHSVPSAPIQPITNSGEPRT